MVLKVADVVKYAPAGEIVNVMLSLVIGFIHEAALPLLQEFQIAFRMRRLSARVGIPDM